MKKGRHIEKWIDTSVLEKKVYCGRECYDYAASVGRPIPFRYGPVTGTFEILSVGRSIEKKTTVVDLKYGGKIKRNMNTYDVFQKVSLGGLVGYNTHEYKLNVGERVRDRRRDLKIIRVYRDKKRRKKADFLCRVCGRKNKGVLEEAILNGVGCSVCSGKKVVPGINDIPTTAPWMSAYFQGGEEEAARYTRTSSKKVYFRCPECGRIRRKPLNIYTLYNRHSIGCVCKDGVTYPEKFMACFFEAVGEKSYRRQVSPKELWGAEEHYRYDGSFVWKGCLYLVEIHGLGHYEDIRFSGKQRQTLQDTVENDRRKQALAERHSISGDRYIALDCRYSRPDYIKQSIENSALAQIYADHLKGTDWEAVERKARKSVKREIIRYAEENPCMSTRIIAEYFRVSRNLVSRTLRERGGYDREERARRKDKSFYENRTRRVAEQIEDYISEHDDCRIEDVAAALNRSKAGVYQICRKQNIDIARCRENAEEHRKSRTRETVSKRVAVVLKAGGSISFSSQSEAIRYIHENYGVDMSAGGLSTALKREKIYKGFLFVRE